MDLRCLGRFVFVVCWILICDGFEFGFELVDLSGILSESCMVSFWNATHI